MTICRFKDPKTNQVYIGTLNEQGICEYNPETSKVKVDGNWSAKERKENLEKKAKAPELSHLTQKELNGLYCGYQNFCSPAKSDLDDEKLKLYAKVTTPYKKKACVITLDDVPILELEKKIQKHNVFLDKEKFQDPDYVLRAIKKNLKLVIPFFPKMGKFLSVRTNLYFTHMMWFIGIFADKETGIANIRQKFFQNYLHISASTERRLREFFVKNSIFNCTYDRKTHYLRVSVNWEGLDDFLRKVDENLVIFPEEMRKKTLETPIKEEDVKLEEVLAEELDHALDKAIEAPVNEPSKEPEEPTKDPITIKLTASEKGSFDPFAHKVDVDSSALSHTQIQTAIADLGCSNLFNPEFIKKEARYIGCDPKHVLLPFFETGTYDTSLLLQALIREAPSLMPIPRPFEAVPEFYYQGEDHEMNPFWSAREKMTFSFTRRIAHLVGVSPYKKIIGEISVVEWNSVPADFSPTGKPLTQFILATRNGHAAHIIGVFLTWMMSKYEDDSFEFHIVPLENGVSISNEVLDD